MPSNTIVSEPIAVAPTKVRARKPKQKVAPHELYVVEIMMRGAMEGPTAVLGYLRDLRDAGEITRADYFRTVMLWADRAATTATSSFPRMGWKKSDEVAKDAMVSILRRWEEPAFADMYLADSETVEAIYWGRK